MMHVFFPRFYEIERAGKVIVRGQALWMLIDEESRQMIMPEDYDIFIPGRPGSDDMMMAPVVIPSELRGGEPGSDGNGLVIMQDLVTRFSQVDINGHMNNTRYFDIIDDALYTWSSASDRAGSVAPDDSQPDCLKGTGLKVPGLVRANYLSELKAGDSFTLSGYAGQGSGKMSEDAGKAGTTMYFEGADGDKVKFRIAYEF
jgi:hypothetical protein